MLVPEAQVKGQMLLDANCASSNTRYKENEKVIFELDIGVFNNFCDVVQAMKLCDCLEYQSSAIAEWKISKACELLKEIIESLRLSVPGYKEAKWFL